MLLDMERPYSWEKDIGKGAYAYYELLPNPHSSMNVLVTTTTTRLGNLIPTAVIQHI